MTESDHNGAILFQARAERLGRANPAVRGADEGEREPGDQPAEVCPLRQGRD